MKKRWSSLSIRSKSVAAALVVALSALAAIRLRIAQHRQRSLSDDPSATPDSVVLLNVSYDPTRELYEAYNDKFTAYWKQETGGDITIRQSHGGSGSQAALGH